MKALALVDPDGNVIPKTVNDEEKSVWNAGIMHVMRRLDFEDGAIARDIEHLESLGYRMVAVDVALAGDAPAKPEPRECVVSISPRFRCFATFPDAGQ